jgi:hypothetical protein
MRCVHRDWRVALVEFSRDPEERVLLEREFFEREFFEREIHSLKLWVKKTLLTTEVGGMC